MTSAIDFDPVVKPTNAESNDVGAAFDPENPEQIIEARFRIIEKFYTSPEYSRIIEDKIGRFPEYKESFIEFAQLQAEKTNGRIKIDIL